MYIYINTYIFDLLHHTRTQHTGLHTSEKSLRTQYTYIHTYIHTYTHTHTHIYAYIQSHRHIHTRLFSFILLKNKTRHAHTTRIKHTRFPFARWSKLYKTQRSRYLTTQRLATARRRSHLRRSMVTWSSAAYTRRRLRTCAERVEMRITCCLMSSCFGVWCDMTDYSHSVRDEEERMRREEERVLALADRAQLKRLCNGLTTAVEHKRLSSVRSSDYSPST